MDKLTYVKATPILLKNHPEYDEQWLKKEIKDDPSILGLGDLIVKDVERIQPKAGRLDLLLHDSDNEKRYEVEIMLGRIDESHIIRTIEYWDLERKRFPNYEHCAVVIAEDIGLSKRGRPNNFIVFRAKKKFLRVEARINDMDSCKNALEEKDIEIVSLDKRSGRIKFRVTKADINNNRETLKQIFETAYKEWNE
jgi:hypothetical protein